MIRGYRTGLRLLATLAFGLGAMAAVPGETGGEEQRFPDVLGAEITPRGENRFDFDVTISSPYDTPARYADGFRVSGLDGERYGERKLLHDHAEEQPFTRDLYGVEIPAGVRRVVIQARDQRYGYGGKSIEVDLPGR